MALRTFAPITAVFVLATAAYSQTGGMQVVRMDGSVGNKLKVKTEFPLAPDPGQVRVRIGRLTTRTLEACMASTDFSTAVPMDRRNYLASYDAETGTQHFSFGVEREMKLSGEDLDPIASSCHVVRFASSCCDDGRDFMLWPRGGSSNPASVTDLTIDPRNLMQDGSVRFIQYSVTGGSRPAE